MPKQYQPTGRPPGRPRNDSKPAVVREHIRDAVSLLRETTVDRAHRPMNAYCPDCFAGGFPQGVRQMVCGHGVWVKR